MGILKQLHAADFRNFTKLDLEFVRGINLFLGQNGQGKSNLLEAIHYLSLLRSFRTSQIRNLYRWGTSCFLVRGEVEADSSHSKLAVQYGAQRRLMVNRESISLASDFIGRFFCVTFVPEDIELVKGSGADRRRFLDILASQLYHPYITSLQEYTKALKGRNALLRAERVDERQIRAYDKVLADRGAVVLQVRLQVMDRLKVAVAEVAPRLYPEGRKLTLRYSATVETKKTDDLEAIAAAFRQELQDSLDRDIARCHTQRGPHRDELHIYLNDKALSQFGSEGQCRLAVLALKMAAGELIMRDKAEETVIWLVDDVVGELDGRARRAFFDCLERADQAFVVATDKEVIAGLPFEATFEVVSGEVSRKPPEA